MKILPYLVSSTPRAEQFEDRLKTIIHSVLAGDSDQREAAAAKTSQDIKPQLHVLPYTSHSPPQNPTSSKPMFSPVKKELQHEVENLKRTLVKQVTIIISDSK